MAVTVTANPSPRIIERLSAGLSASGSSRLNILIKTGACVASVPLALLVWGAVCIGVSTLLTRLTLGKALYLIGNRAAAAYFVGIGTRQVVVFAFVLCGLAAALSGVTLAG